MSKSAELASLIQARAGAEAPEYGLILGSGLGHLSQAVDGVAIPYDDLPGFPHAGVSGHVPQLVIGQLEGARVAVFGGRFHPNVWFPYGPRNTVFYPSIECSPCHRDDCPLYEEPECLKRTGVDEVVEASLKFLDV